MRFQILWWLVKRSIALSLNEVSQRRTVWPWRGLSFWRPAICYVASQPTCECVCLSTLSQLWPGLCQQVARPLFWTAGDQCGQKVRPLLPRLALATSAKWWESNALLALKPTRIELPVSFCQQRVRAAEWVGNSHSRAAVEGGGERGLRILAASLESDKP